MAKTQTWLWRTKHKGASIIQNAVCLFAINFDTWSSISCVRVHGQHRQRTINIGPIMDQSWRANVLCWVKQRVAKVGPMLTFWTSPSWSDNGMPTLDQYMAGSNYVIVIAIVIDYSKML